MRVFHTTKHRHTLSMEEKIINKSSSQFITSKLSPSKYTSIHKKSTSSSTKLANLLQHNKSLRVQTAVHNRTRSTATELYDPQLRVYQEFKSNSYLYTKHEYLMSKLSTTSKEVINHLNLNFFKVQSFNTNTQSLLFDQQLLYTMFSTLQEIDKNIIIPLFSNNSNNVYIYQKDQIGQQFLQQNIPAKHKFKLDYIDQIQSLLNEPIAFILRRISQQDQSIALFIESLWKFQVLINDTLVQWIKDRCQNYVDLEVKNIKDTLNDQIKENNRLHDQYHTLQKTSQFQLAVEMTKYQNLVDKYNILQDEFKDFKQSTYDYASLDKAESNMRLLRFKIRDMDQAISMVDRVQQEERIDIMSQIRDIGRVLINVQDENKPYYLILQKKIKSQVFKENPLLIHPFCYLVEMKTDKDKSDAKEDLIRYFKYLQDNQKQITNNLDNLIIWGGWAKSKNIVNWILNNYVEEDIAQFYSKVFGLNNNNLISISKLKKILQLSKDVVNDQQQNNVVIQEQFKLLMDTKEDNQLAKILTKYCQRLDKQEQQDWEIKTKKWKQSIIGQGINSDWFTDKQDLWIWRLVMQKYSGCSIKTRRQFENMDLEDQLKDLEQTFEWIRRVNIWMNYNKIDNV